MKGKAMSSGLKSNMVILYLTGLMLLLSNGCQEERRGVDLYLDAIMFRELDQNEMAIEKLNEAIKLDKQFLPAYSMLGEIYSDNNDYEKSAAAYEKATQISIWSFQDYYNLGRAYQGMKNFDQASKAYARACELKSDHLEAHINAARCFYEVEDYTKALMFGQLAEQIDPNAIKVQMLLADIFQAQNDYDGIIDSLEHALQIDGNNPDIMTPLALAYLKTEQYEPAKQLFILITQNQTDNGTAYQQLGYCYLKLGDIDYAVESYNKALKINNKDWQLHKNLGTAYMLKAAKDKDQMMRLKAIQHWKMSLAIEPDQPNWEALLKLIEKYSK